MNTQVGFGFKMGKRRGWDSNPRVLSHKLISSQPRYDHFDTSPYAVNADKALAAITILCDADASLKYIIAQIGKYSIANYSLLDGQNDYQALDKFCN